MKRIYDNFAEIADDFVNGESWTHQLSKHTDDECIVWQRAIREFAAWMDSAGIPLIKKPSIYESLWGLIRSFSRTEVPGCRDE